MQQDQALVLAVLADIANAMAMERSATEAMLTGCARDADLAAGLAVKAEHGLGQFAAAGADEAIEPEDLAGADAAR